MPFSYVNQASGLTAGRMEWFNFDNLPLTDNQTAASTFGVTGYA